MKLFVLLQFIFLFCLFSCSSEGKMRSSINEICIDSKFEFEKLHFDHVDNGFDYYQFEVYKLVSDNHVEFLNSLFEGTNGSCLNWEFTDKLISGKKSNNKGLIIQVEYVVDKKVLIIETNQI